MNQPGYYQKLDWLPWDAMKASVSNDAFAPSVGRRCKRVVYVDSGSTDGSVEFAQSIGVDVVPYDMNSAVYRLRGA